MSEFSINVVWNLFLCVPFGFLIWCLCRLPQLSARPNVCHGLWLVVLLKLIMPPFVFLPILPAVGESPVAATSTNDPSAFLVQESSSSNISPLTTDAVSNPSAEESFSLEQTASSVLRSPDVQYSHSPTRFSSWLNILNLIVVLSGSVTLILWFMAIQQVQRIRRLFGSAATESHRVDRLIDQLVQRFELKVRPTLVVVDSAVAPVLWADWGRAFIVLPKLLVDSLDDDRLRNVIAHELAHYARRDHWSNVFAFGVTTLLWWHPIAWLARRELCQAAESCCDAMVVDRCGESRKSYAQTLMTVVDFVNSGRLLRPALGPSFSGTDSLRRRIEMLANAGIKTRVSLGGWSLLLTVAIVSTLLPARAQVPKRPSSVSPEAKPADVPPDAAGQAAKPDENLVRIEAGKYYVSGSVIDEQSNQPIPQAKLIFLVEAEPDQNKRLRRVSTDDLGQFRFETPIGTTKLWFPDLKPGYWLEPEDGRKAVATTKDQPVAVMEIIAKRGPVWPVKVIVEGGVPENTIPVVSVMEMADDAVRKKAVNGEYWALWKLPARSSCWLTDAGAGGLTQCGTTGKLFVTANISFDPSAKVTNAYQDPNVSIIHTELLVDPAFDVTNVESATPVKDTDIVEMVDGNGAKATIAKAQVSIKDRRPLLTFQLARNQSKLKTQEFVGRVVDAAEKPISDVRVGAVVGEVGGGSGDTGLSVTTDQEGRFVMKLPLHESKQKQVLSLVLNKDGFAGEDSRDYPIPIEPTDPIDVGKLTLDAGFSYRIRIVDGQGQPISGAVIEPMSSYALRRLEVRTDAEGRGILRNLPQGVVSVSIRHGEKYLNRKIVVNPAGAETKEQTLKLDGVPSSTTEKTPAVQEKEPIAVGQIAPQFAVSQWTDQKAHQLSDYRGRVVVLDFWGIWCGGCVTSIPMIQELETKYQSKGVAFLGIHTADGELDQINELKKLHNWKTVTGIDQGKTNADGGTASRYGVSGYPTIIVIDGAGKIAFNSGIQPASEDEFMNELQQFAKALDIPWPLPEKEEKETMAQMNRIFAAKIGKEIDKALASVKTSK